ncbi:MAG: hypothetical protein IJW51_00005, partial [Clostridia bacterium]|nr:hypothetical protein [Clostridia bacterium]
MKKGAVSNATAFGRQAPMVFVWRLNTAMFSQYQPKSNTPKAMKIRAISRNLARKVILCFAQFQKISSNFHSLYVRII